MEPPDWSAIWEEAVYAAPFRHAAFRGTIFPEEGVTALDEIGDDYVYIEFQGGDAPRRGNVETRRVERFRWG